MTKKKSGDSAYSLPFLKNINPKIANIQGRQNKVYHILTSIKRVVDFYGLTEIKLYKQMRLNI